MPRCSGRLGLVHQVEVPRVTLGRDTMAPMLEVRDLAIKYRRRLVVEGVSLNLNEASSAAIVGRSGSGKSSILAAIVGLVRPSAGSIVFDGKNVLRLSDPEREQYLRHDVAVVFQHGELLDDLEPRENILVAALLSGMDRAGAIERADALLKELSLPARGITARDMSGGERQRVAIARALVTSPRLVVADEPTGSLDVEFRDVVGDLILAIPERWGSALLMVTHDESLAMRADRVYRLQETADGPSRLDAA